MEENKFYCKRSNTFVPGQDSIARILGHQRSDTFVLGGVIEVNEDELTALKTWAEHCNEDGSSLLEESN